MPRKPKRPCSYPGCHKLVDGQYCEEHKKLIDKHRDEHESFTLRKLNMLDFIWIIMTRGSKHLLMKLQLKFGI